MSTVDLFAGCGGFSFGWGLAGFEIVAAYDNWPAARDCYVANLQHPAYLLDLSNVEAAVAHIAGFQPEIIVGGPPCQDFSHAGRRTEANRADLTRSFAQIVTSLPIPPQVVVMENVDRIVGSAAYAYARDALVSAGYGLTERIIDASLCNVPQKRKRFFAVGLLHAPHGFLEEYLDAGLAERPLTIREYLGPEIQVVHYYRHPRNYNRRGIYSVDEPSPTIRGVNRPFPPGYRGHPSDPVAPFEGLRALSTIERGRIQTFPEDWRWVGKKTHVEQMIGNAVPPNLALYVGNALQQYLHHNANRLNLELNPENARVG